MKKEESLSYSSIHDISNTSYVEDLKESYEKVKRFENELVYGRTLPGIKFDTKIVFKLLKRADKELQFQSKIPKSILKNERILSNDVRYNYFLKIIEKIFETQFFNKIKIKNNL